MKDENFNSSKNNDICIIIATHKKYKFPSDDVYLPLHVGKKGKSDIGLQGDDDGVNISDKNPYYCELTGLYWAWKNSNSKYIGLVHYRRHFSSENIRSKDKFKQIIGGSELKKIINNYDIIVPTKRRYYIESLYSHYANTHYIEHLDLAEEIIKNKYPEYYSDYKNTVRKTSGYMFNMTIMRNNLLDSYCTWLFSILSEIEGVVEIDKLSAFHARFYGRLSEILFNVWLANILKQKPELKVKELKHIHMEKINWFKKGKSFLMAKFSNKKYEGSF